MKIPLRIREINGKFYPQYRFWFSWITVKSIGECPVECDTIDEARKRLCQMFKPKVVDHPVNLEQL